MTTLIENNNTSFKSQFDLEKGGNKSDGFMKNDYSYLTEPSTYGREEVSVNTMHPFNYMSKFKNNPNINHVNRRDNTLIINDYHSNVVGQYAKKKEEQKSMFDNVSNPNALAGDTKIVDKISLDRFTSSLQYKANDFPDNTNIRPELIDGTPMTEVVRPREKTLEQLRGEGVNSVRLAPEGRSNETAGLITGGKSTDPKTINITKYKLKSYRDQTVEDLLKTTGQITRPEWRSMVRQTNSERSFMASIDGPAMAPVMRQTYHSDQAARPTNRTEYEDNVHIMNAANTVGGMPEMRNEQLAKPTSRTDYENNNYVSNAVSSVGGREEFRNEQLAKPTFRTDYENNTNIINAKSFVPNAEFRNEQLAKPTIRTDYENNTNIINAGGFIPNAEYRNEQSANPTYRTDYEHNTNITNSKSFVPNHEYRNEQLAKPTFRTDYENNNFMGHGNNSSVGHVYENNQAATATHRTDYENNNFTGAGYNQTNSQYKTYGDITRSGVVEEVLARDYKGGDFSFVPRQEDRTMAVNMIQNQSVEDSIDLTKRNLMGGGTDRIPQGRENIGEYNDRDRREKMPPITNRVRNVAVNYIQEVPETRGYNLLLERSNINQYVPEVINNNPFINNIVYTTNAPRDIIRENTFIYDRNTDRE